MPLALLAALAGSLALHAAALFLPDVDLSTAPEAPPPIVAEILPPPAPAAAAKSAETPVAKPEARSRRAKPAKTAPATRGAVVEAAPVADAQPEIEPALQAEAVAEAAPEPPSEPAAKPEAQAAPSEPRLPGSGFIRFAVYKGGQGLLVGRAEHAWEFAGDGYRLKATTETVGLAALFKPIQIELESRGKLTAGGLQPQSFRTRRNGGETKENADFDWATHQVTMGRDGSRREMDDGAQDLLSFHYQLAYLANLRDGTRMGVASGKKFEIYRFDTVGQEDVDTPAGHFRTLHVRVQTDSTTELWLALERRLLPVKIRHTDRKGESFEQVATEIGMP